MFEKPNNESPPSLSESSAFIAMPRRTLDRVGYRAILHIRGQSSKLNYQAVHRVAENMLPLSPRPHWLNESIHLRSINPRPLESPPHWFTLVKVFYTSSLRSWHRSHPATKHSRFVPCQRVHFVLRRYSSKSSILWR